MTDENIIEIGEEVPATGETADTQTLVEDSARDFLTTPFEDYTVTEGLLLTIAFLLVILAVVRVIREVF